MIVVATVLTLALVCVAVPWCRLEFRRRASRSHRPQPCELWLQDHDQLLYIEAVTDAGISLLTLDPTTRQLLRWVDSWPTWHERLRARVVMFTGRSGVLNPSEWDFMWT